MWLPIWLIVAIVGHRQVHVAGQPTRSGAASVAAVIGGLFLLGLAIAHWPVFLCLGVLAGVGYLGYRAYERSLDRRTEQTKIANRADAQNRALLFGDDRAGIYGQYPPVQPPDPPR
jgi:UDP-N-acetylmuramyl pentapeptide phosphotransferase/UDP-N-acetylglucosamine-1-phosphate transferase